MAAPDFIPDLLKAVNDASGKAFALWITFLTVEVYLAISIGTTTHVQLLLAGPVKLPLLGVDLPLFAFYEFAPPLFLVLHLYVLMQLYLLSRTLRLFDAELQGQQAIKKDLERIRGQLDKFVFTQLLINKPDAWVVRQFLRLTVWLSFVVGPVLLLLAFQIQFLPYHSVPTTDLHRITILLDIALLWAMWPKISGGGTRPAWVGRGQQYIRLLGFVCAGLLVFSVGVATIPGEGFDQANLSNVYPFARFLVIVGAKLVEPDSDKLSKLDHTLSLSGRDLRFAVIPLADLRKSDLREANLSGASLDITNLSGADLSGAILNGANLSRTNLNAADLSGAKLSDADLSGAKLSGAKLSDAILIRTNLNAADLSGAAMYYANLSDANLSGANLSDAQNLTQAQLDAACGKPPKLAAGSSQRWDAERPCPEKPVAPPLNRSGTP